VDKIPFSEYYINWIVLQQFVPRLQGRKQIFYRECCDDRGALAIAIANPE
jgi:hypothetical protein